MLTRTVGNHHGERFRLAMQGPVTPVLPEGIQARPQLRIANIKLVECGATKLKLDAGNALTELPTGVTP